MSKKFKQSINVSSLVLCALLISLSFVLGMIKIIPMPYGGSITLFSMLAATSTGYFCGPKWGILSCISLGLLNLIVHPVILFPLQILLDYVLAFGVLGLSGFFSEKKHGLALGYSISVFCRFLCSFFSGFLFFAEYAGDLNPIWYSFTYNIFYLGGECSLTLIVLALGPVKETFSQLKKQSLNL